MSAEKITVYAADPGGKGLYRVGGISALVLGLAYIGIMLLYVPVGRPTGAEAWLSSLAGNTARWWAIVGLDVLTDFLLVPIAFALYLALKRINNNAMVLATALVGLFVVLDLALTWTNSAALIELSGGYAAATDGAQRAAFVTAAMYPSTVLESNLLFVYNTLTLTLGILITSSVMLRGIFGKATAYAGVAVGFFGIVAVAGSFLTSALGFAVIIASLLTTVWALLVGYRLFRLG
jgi:hypothetical protein